MVNVPNLLMTTGVVERRPRGQRTECAICITVRQRTEGMLLGLRAREGTTLRNAVLPRCRDCCALRARSHWLCMVAHSVRWPLRGLCTNSIVTINKFCTIPFNFGIVCLSFFEVLGPLG